jgi:threonylcarbamoyladenosine tRNA methylthiotransferase MtaB
MPRAAIVNLGCKVNQSEVDAAGRLLRERGVVLVDERTPAELVLVNTCTVTGVADQKSRQAVRRARRTNPGAAIVVTGCSAQVAPAAFTAIDPRVRLIDNEGKASLLGELAAILGVPERAGDALPVPNDALLEPLPTLSGVEIGLAGAVDGIADDRGVADRTRAFVKVQDGCSFHCTYCIIPRARGPERSLAPETVLADVRRALAAGHREIVLTGINIGTYDGGWSERGARGSHVRSALTLAGLVRRILSETEVERIRLSSIEPQHVDEDLLETWAGPGAGRCLPHFHLPLQSGDDGVLRRMGRRYDSGFYAALVARVRDAVAGVAVHADVIVGFPTEDHAAFERSRAFVAGLGLAGLHVFRYSARPGTAATRMVGQVPEAERRARAAAFLALAAEARARTAAARLGGESDVLFESRLPDGRWLGHAEDHVVVAALPPDRRPLDNAIGRAVLERLDPVVPDRVEGRLLRVDLGRRLRPPLPMAGAPEPVSPSEGDVDVD